MGLVGILSEYAIPVVFLVILCIGTYRDVKVYDVFIEGAKEGIATTVKIMPSLVGLLVAVGVFRASGALDLVIYAFRPIASLTGIPPELLPLAFLRPISGSASLALLADIMEAYGTDSLIGMTASTMMGSTETIFYTLAVYFSSVGIKKTRYTLMAALVADAVSVIASVWVCARVFGGR